MKMKTAKLLHPGKHTLDLASLTLDLASLTLDLASLTLDLASLTLDLATQSWTGNPILDWQPDLGLGNPILDLATQSWTKIPLIRIYQFKFVVSIKTLNCTFYWVKTKI